MDDVKFPEPAYEYFCTKCGNRGVCEKAPEHPEQGVRCEHCPYTAFVLRKPWTDDDMLAIHEQGRLAGLEEAQKDKRDAERYRFIRDYNNPDFGICEWDRFGDEVFMSDEDADRRIDAAIRAIAAPGAGKEK